jgi:hypothetical protein
MKKAFIFTLLFFITLLSVSGASLPPPFYYGAEYESLSADFDFDRDIWESSTDTGIAAPREMLSEGLVPDIKIAKDSTIKISGSKRISFEVARKTYPNVSDIADSNYFQSSGSIEPDINQQLQVKVEGVIKNRIFIDVDYDDTKEMEDREHISVVYKGTEDEIVREIALGDLTLSLPRTDFITFNRQLFGAKATLVMGPYSYYGLITKEEGITGSDSFTGYSDMTQNSINNTYFLISPVYLSLQQGIPGIALPLKTGEVYLYYDDGIFNDEDEGRIHTGEFYFEPLSPLTDYVVDYDKGVIVLKKTLSSTGTVAMIYTDANGITYGNPDPASFSYATLVYSKRNETEYQLLRQQFQQKNVYSLGHPDLDINGLTLEIMDLGNKTEITVTAEDSSQKTYSYMYLFGIDRDRDGAPDLSYLKLDNGYLDFSFYESDLIELSTLQPFNTKQFLSESEPSGIVPDLPPYLEAVRSEIGDGPFVALMQVLDNSGIYEEGSSTPRKYMIYTEYFSPQPVFNLGRFNIIEGSEKVVVNGEVLFRGRDYSIDYLTGTVQILNESVVTENAAVTITFEYRPLMMSKSKTLIGNRLEYNPNEHLSVGATYMDEWMPESNDETIPRLGDETTRHSVYGANINYTLNEKDYNIMAKAEAAKSLVNPNTYGMVYLEDMESSEQVKSISLSKSSWFIASSPEGFSPENRFVPTYSVSDGSVFDAYNYFTNDYVELSQINSNYGTGDNMILTFRQLPGVGVFTSYATIVSQNGMDMSDYKQLEIWYRVNTGGTGTIHLDLGYISEDADSDGILDSEDTDGNMVLNAGEDIGFLFNLLGSVYPIGELNGVLDTEDLNRNGIMNDSEAVVHYSFDLGEGDSPEGNEWHVLTIPLDSAADYDESILKVVKNIRLWGEGFSSGTEFALGRLAVVGTVWEVDEVYPAGSTLEISSISQYDDPNYINLHHEVDKETDRVLEDVSLVMDFDMIPDGADESHAFSRKDLGTSRDFTLYNKLRIYYFPKETDGDYSFTVRLMTSQDNYFEKKVSVLPGDLGAWHYLEFDMGRIDDVGEGTVIMGEPNIKNINYILIGVSGENGPYSGILYVNDIRLVDSTIQEGMARSATLQVNYKNYAGAYYQYNNKDGKFAPIGQSPGEINTVNHAFRGNVNFAKWFWEESGVNLPINVNYSNSLSETDSSVLSGVTYRSRGRTESDALGVIAKLSKDKWPTLSYSYNYYEQNVDNETKPLYQKRVSHDIGLNYLPPEARFLTMNWLPDSFSFNYKRDTSDYLNLKEENKNTDYMKLTENWRLQVNWLPFKGLRSAFAYNLTDQWDQIEELYISKNLTSSFDNSLDKRVWIMDFYAKYRAQYRESWSYERAMNEGNYSFKTFDLSNLYETRMTLHLIRYAKIIPLFQKKLDLTSSFKLTERSYYDLTPGKANAGVFIGSLKSLDVEGDPDQETSTQVVSLEAKTDFIDGVSFNLNYDWTTKDTDNAGNIQEEEVINWPDASLTLNTFRMIPLLARFDRFVVSHSLSLRYSEKESMTYGYYSRTTRDQSLFGEWRVSWSGMLTTRCYYKKSYQENITTTYDRDNERNEGYLEFSYRVRNAKLLKGLFKKSENKVNTLLTLNGNLRYTDQQYTVGTDYHSFESSFSGKYDFGTGMTLSALLGYNIYRSEIPTKDYNEIKLGGEFEIRF